MTCRVICHALTWWCALQVATDTRLWLYNQLKVIRAALHELIKVATERSNAEVDVLMPGEGLLGGHVWISGHAMGGTEEAPQGWVAGEECY